MTHQRISAISAVMFFFVWLAILYAGADHPPPHGFVLVILLDLAAASLVFWRVPYYLSWMGTEQSNWLLKVVRDGLVVGVAFALSTILARLIFGFGEPTVTPTMRGVAIWFAVLAGVGVANALAVYLSSMVLRRCQVTK